jgi:hypothetical protein
VQLGAEWHHLIESAQRIEDTSPKKTRPELPA